MTSPKIREIISSMKLIAFLTILAITVIWFKTMDTPRGEEFQSENASGITYGELKKIQENSAREQTLRKNRADLQNEVLTPRVNTQGGRGSVVPHVVEIQPDSASYDTADEPPREIPTLDGQMNAFLAEKQRFQEMRAERRAEFAKEFIVKARAMGYLVIMDDQMQITEVRKVPRKR